MPESTPSTRVSRSTGPRMCSPSSRRCVTGDLHGSRSSSGWVGEERELGVGEEAAELVPVFGQLSSWLGESGVGVVRSSAPQSLSVSSLLTTEGTDWATRGGASRGERAEIGRNGSPRRTGFEFENGYCSARPVGSISVFLSSEGGGLQMVLVLHARSLGHASKRPSVVAVWAPQEGHDTPGERRRGRLCRVSRNQERPALLG